MFNMRRGEQVKLVLTILLTLGWLALLLFFPFRAPEMKEISGAVAFWTLVGSLAVGAIWMRWLLDDRPI